MRRSCKFTVRGIESEIMLSQRISTRWTKSYLYAMREISSRRLPIRAWISSVTSFGSSERIRRLHVLCCTKRRSTSSRTSQRVQSRHRDSASFKMWVSTFSRTCGKTTDANSFAATSCSQPTRHSCKASCSAKTICGWRWAGICCSVFTTRSRVVTTRATCSTG